MDVIELTRELGKAIQQDERFWQCKLHAKIVIMMMNYSN